MTQNYHSPIALGAPADAATFNTPYGTLDQQITANTAAIAADVANLASLIAGNTGFTQLNLGAVGATVTINTDAITITQSEHVIDTQGAAATDDLITINGGVEGDVLNLRIANNARVVVVRNTGNIRSAHGGDLYLDNVNMELRLYFTGSYWIQQTSHLYIQDMLNNKGYGRGFGVPYGSLRTSGYHAANGRPFLDFTPRWSARNWFGFKAAAATFAEVGMAAGTSAGAGALSEQNNTDSVYVQQAITNVAGTFGGRRSSTFDLVRMQYNPYFACLIRIPADVSNIRGYFGLCAAQVTNVDALVTSFLGLRYSTVAADPAWMACTSDGVNTSILTTGVGVAADTAYLLEGWFDGTNWWASVNGSTPVSIASNLPAGTTELGVTATLITTTATAKNIQISRVWVDMN